MVLTQWRRQKSHWHWRRISTRRIGTITLHWREIQPLGEFISTPLTREQISFCAVPHLSKIDQKAPFWSRSSFKPRKHNENRLCSGSLWEVLNEPLIPAAHVYSRLYPKREPTAKSRLTASTGALFCSTSEIKPWIVPPVQKKCHRQAQDVDTLNKARFAECSGLWPPHQYTFPLKSWELSLLPLLPQTQRQQ